MTKNGKKNVPPCQYKFLIVSPLIACEGWRWDLIKTDWKESNKLMETTRWELLRDLSPWVTLSAVALLAMAPVKLRAAAFTPGNLVVYRVGDGSANEVNTGNPVFLDEFTTDGTLVQSIALPTAANGAQKPLVASGVGTSEGFLTRSTDGRCLLVPGYGTTTGGSSLSGTTAASVPRVIGRVDGSGNIDTSTALTDWISGNAPRSAASTDGTVFWGGGGVGLNYASALGNTTSTALTTANTRQVAIFNGQLYVSASGAAPSIHGIGSVGTGTPTATGQTFTLLPGFTDNVTLKSPNSFFFCHLNGAGTAVDTLYVCDDTTTGAPGGINKFSLVGGSWVSNGSAGMPADAYAGLCATVSGTTVTLYATRKFSNGSAGGGELVQAVDTSGYDASIGSPTITLLASSGSKKAFRGVTLAPKAPPTFNLISSANPSGYQDGVAFTANTILPADATGTIQFTTNGGNLGSAVPISGGRATSPATTDLPRGSTNAIQAIYSGDANYFSLTNTLTQAVTNHPPAANDNTYNWGGWNSNTWQIATGDLLANTRDTDGDAVTLIGLSLSTNGVTLDTNSTPGYVLYTNVNPVDDQFNYTVVDGHGGTNTGTITLTYNTTGGVTGTNSIAKIVTGNPTTLTAYGVVNYTYITQRSTNMVNWVDVQTNIATDGAITVTDCFSDLGSQAPAAAFYRLKWNRN
jgi:hypothetical protein